MTTTEINIPARRVFAELLRQFHSGRMTNFQYDDRFWRMTEELGSDQVIESVYWTNWCLYDDIRRHRMTDRGHRLGRRLRRQVAQAVLMLRTDEASSSESVIPAADDRFDWRFAIGLSVVGGLVVLLLKSPAMFMSALMFLMTIGKTFSAWESLKLRLQPPEPDHHAEFDPPYWPFVSAQAFQTACVRPVYLAGA